MISYTLISMVTALVLLSIYPLAFNDLSVSSPSPLSKGRSKVWPEKGRAPNLGEGDCGGARWSKARGRGEVCGRARARDRGQGKEQWIWQFLF